MSPLISASLFLIQALFNLYLFILLLRFFIQLSGASFSNPIAQFTFKWSNRLTQPLQKYLPRSYKIDYATLFWIIFLNIIKLLLLAKIGGTPTSVLSFIVLLVADLLSQIISFYVYMILIWMLMSWLGPSRFNFMGEVIFRLIKPLIAPWQRHIPRIAGVDISPLILLIVLKTFEILVIGYLTMLAAGLV